MQHLLAPLAKLGTLYLHVERFATEYAREPSLGGLVMQAFAIAILDYLRHYRARVMTAAASSRARRSTETSGTSVEHEPSATRDTQHENSATRESKGMTLLEVLMHTRLLRSQLEWLAQLCRINISGDADFISHLPTGPDLLCYLFTVGTISHLDTGTPHTHMNTDNHHHHHHRYHHYYLPSLE
jgi:hypothetical protein